MQDFQSKVAVITGGGSGLGRELALGCARRGMKLVLGDVDETGMQETVRLLEQCVPGCQSATLRVDVSRLEDVQALAELAQQRFGGAHLLFNNAGVAINGPVWEHTAADWQWVLGVNLYGVAWGIKAFVPLMLAQGEGYIVNTASAAGWMNAPGSGIYNVSKCGVVAMSETLALDLQDVGAAIGVSVLSPAFFPTPIIESERNRPQEFGDTGPSSEIRRQREAQLRHAVTRGRLSAADIAEQTLQAVEQRRFYIFPHGKIKALIHARATAAEAEQQPFDPLGGR
jgi:NAD(P)-dependent dehydrogenase (short-subunit alcohol dehydrogenase family)